LEEDEGGDLKGSSISLNPIAMLLVLKKNSRSSSKGRKKRIEEDYRLEEEGKTTASASDTFFTLSFPHQVLGVRQSHGSGRVFSDLQSSVEDLDERDTASDSPSLTDALGCTHDVNLLNGELIGEPLEISMLQWAKYELEENSHKVALSRDGVSEGEGRNLDGGNATVSVVKSSSSGKRFALVNKYDFASSLRRMSVIIKPEESTDSIVYVKGAPEALGNIINPATLPDDFQTVLDSITHVGYRVLALAGKKVKDLSWDEAQRMTRLVNFSLL